MQTSFQTAIAHTLNTRNNLADAYESAGRRDEAIALYEQVVTGLTRVLGPDHPRTLTVRHSLACAYASAERLDEAITLFEQVITDRARILGDNQLPFAIRAMRCFCGPCGRHGAGDG